LRTRGEENTVEVNLHGEIAPPSEHLLKEQLMVELLTNSTNSLTQALFAFSGRDEKRKTSIHSGDSNTREGTGLNMPNHSTKLNI
jgi:hypothetical protein